MREEGWSESKGERLVGGDGGLVEGREGGVGAERGREEEGAGDGGEDIKPRPCQGTPPPPPTPSSARALSD